MSAKRVLSTFCAASALALAAGVASAATVTIQSITAEWSGAINGPNGSNASYDNSDNPVTLRWGTASNSENKRSGYDFEAVSTPTEALAEESLFLLGEFTHHNYTISTGTGIKGANLDLTFTFMLDNETDPGQALHTLTSSFKFEHHETANSGALGNCPYQPSQTVCDDAVYVTTVSGGTTSFEIDGVMFHFGVAGFMDSNGQEVNPFITAEAKSNTAGLYASFTSTAIPAPVPLPAGGLLLLGGLAGLGVLRRRRKAA